MRFTIAALALVVLGPFATLASRIQRRAEPPPNSFAEENQEVAELTQDFEEAVEASESLAELNTSAEATVVKLMVVWTKAFECKRYNKELGKDSSSCNTNKRSKQAALKFVDQSIVTAQNVFRDSKIGATLTVVYKNRHFNHIEAPSGGLVSELSQLNGCKINGLCDIRTNKEAHIVAAFTDNGGLAGAARFGPQRRLRSAALGKAASTYTLAHEIGHLFGCREDRQSTHDADGKSCGSGETWFGYRSQDSKRMDIMSLHCYVGRNDCSIGKKLTTSCQMMPVYSDPNIKYQGYKTGSEKACCACKMRESLAEIVGKMPYRP